ncbi:golgi uridine diphosphate-N- acetylglucosamine transporter [Peltigera leucophlebia]|nr:golgi uridine diphosphate-N- acetylglucosamine transporter [Peltigera leucophlebia]
MVRWLPSIALFFIVNMLNNFAFGYNISVPVHIILRSGGSIMSMLVGYAWGKRYTNLQIFSVAMLTAGIITAAMADAQSKGKTTSSTSIDYSFITGLVILALAQLLSAIMGLYTQLTYASYGSHWHENLFYSHFLSLPFFLPFFPSLLSELNKLFISTPISIFSAAAAAPPPTTNLLLASSSLGPLSISSNSSKITSFLPININISIPSQILNLVANALTQYICIRGVNLLSARTSALGVTIALNVRKLISLFLSIWLFGNELPPGVLVGAAIVFGSAGVWAVEGQRLSGGGGGVSDKTKKGKRKK